MFLRFFVTVALVETVLGLLQGNNHPATTSTPDGTVLHQTLGLLVVELDKRVNDLQNKVAAMETERHQYVEKNQLETALSTERLEVEALRQILQGQNASLSTILLENALQLNATSQLNSTLSSLITDHENLQSDVDHMKISDISISLIKKDVYHMEEQIRGILSHNQFLSGNLSQVQNALHNLHVFRPAGNDCIPERNGVQQIPIMCTETSPVLQHTLMGIFTTMAQSYYRMLTAISDLSMTQQQESSRQTSQGSTPFTWV
uniref:Uncharacterized protein LOC111131263 isoform X3 n=1 Tax=Crassostrea virginica TaxID=6565 RepID=A0A8B8E1L3_CRAVI|nr:uncharacterized protein LOC111131263 isoform X3 [Crassostrea virginica]